MVGEVLLLSFRTVVMYQPGMRTRWPTTTVFGPLKSVICNISIEVLRVVNELVLTELAH
jgi:hypothetical protein